jgi:hypothetical protein
MDDGMHYIIFSCFACYCIWWLLVLQPFGQSIKYKCSQEVNLVTKEEFEKFAKQVMDTKIRKFLREKGCPFTAQEQSVFVDRLQSFLFNEFVTMGYATQLFGNMNITNNSR